METVKWAISLFAACKSPGIDSIYPVLHVAEGIGYIDRFVSNTISSEYCHELYSFSMAKSGVAFVPKPGQTDYTQVKSFHSISLTSFCLKTIERMMDR